MPLSDISALELLSEFPQPMLVMQPSGVLVFANPRALGLLGLVTDPSGRNILEFLPEQERGRLDPLAWMQRWAEVPDAPELAHVHLLVRTEQGRQLPVRVRVGRLRSGEEAFYVVMLQDISAEQDRQQHLARPSRQGRR